MAHNTDLDTMTVATAVNRIAGLLGHSCAVGQDEGDDEPRIKLGEFKSLNQLYWHQKAQSADTMETDCMFLGVDHWEPTFGSREFPHYYGTGGRRSYPDIVVGLSHTTGTGRLVIEAADDESGYGSGRITLSVYAGPEQQGGEGRLCVAVAYRLNRITYCYSDVVEHSLSASLWERPNADLIRGREDRLDILWWLDEEVFGGAFLRWVHEGCAGETAEVLLAAAAHGEEVTT